MGFMKISRNKRKRQPANRNARSKQWQPRLAACQSSACVSCVRWHTTDNLRPNHTHTTPTPHFLKKVVVWVWCWCGVGVVWLWCGCGLGEGCQLCATVLAVFVYATHVTQAIAFEWKPGVSVVICACELA